MRRGLISCFVLLALGAAVWAQQSTPAPVESRLQRCLVSLIDDVKVPAEAAGVLVSVEAREGLQVEVGTLLAKVDDNQVKFQKSVAEADLKVSKEKADNDVNKRYAAAAMKVAQAEYAMNLAANASVPGTKSKVELQKLALTVEQARLQIEQSEHEQTVAKFETEGFVAKVDLANDEIRRRHLKAPISGEVVEVLMRAGEWVEPGEQVLRIVRMDRLRIEGFLNAADFSPSEVSNRPVRVTVNLARGRAAIFQGKIVFVNPLVDAGGVYRVWAEVVNRRDGDQWLLRPGLLADMTIDVGGLAAH
jgi:macrolide-specific efflux system membrane fusion protein